MSQSVQSKHTNYLIGRHGIAKNHVIDDDYLETQMKKSDLRKSKDVKLS